MSGAGDATLSRAVSATPFPWNEVLTFGFSRLHLPPAQFWQLSLRELFWLAGGTTQKNFMTHNDFSALMQRFPD